MAPAASRSKGRKNSRRIEGVPARQRVFAAGRRELLFAVLLAAATVALYVPVHGHPFLNYDDDDYVTNNPQVQAGVTAETVGWAFTSYHAANWHPLTWLSHALDCQVFALNPAGHHDTNLLLHALNVILLFWLLARATGCPGRSAMVAALFALHPINVESVAWVAERKNLLSMTFFLLALAAWRWYARKPAAPRYVATAALYALGLMAKPQVITFPFVVLLWNYWPLDRVAVRGSAAKEAGGKDIIPQKPLSWILVEIIPLLLLSAVSAVVTMRAQKLGGGINPGYPLSWRLANVVVSYGQYVRQAFWPSGLAILYPFHGGSLPGWTVAASGFVLLIITSAVVAYGRRMRYLPVGWFWYLGTLVPMIGIVQVGRQAMADRYAYLPLIGLFLLVSWGAADLANRARIPERWQAAAAVAVLAALVFVSHRQLEVWSDNVALWANATEVTQGNFVAEDNLGRALQVAGQDREAMVHFARSAQIEPSYPYPYVHMGIALHQQGDVRGALGNYEKVIRATQDQPAFSEVRHRIFVNMASAYASLGELARARDSFLAALRLNAGSAEEWTNLGRVSQDMGDLETAIGAYTQAIKLHPSRDGYQLLESALRQAGKEQEAQAAARQAELLGSGAALGR